MIRSHLCSEAVKGHLRLKKDTNSEIQDSFHYSKKLKKSVVGKYPLIISPPSIYAFV